MIEETIRNLLYKKMFVMVLCYFLLLWAHTFYVNYQTKISTAACIFLSRESTKCAKYQAKNGLRSFLNGVSIMKIIV